MTRRGPRFGREEAKIRAALGEAALSVEHIGSTSVPGLAAKPIVDVLLVVEDSGEELSYLPALEGLATSCACASRTSTSTGCSGPRKRTSTCTSTLRTRRRSNATCCCATGCARTKGTASSTARTKRDLASKDWPSMPHYAEAKIEVVEGIIARARWPSRVHHVSCPPGLLTPRPSRIPRASPR
jgi:GrpB-like predicted nucleotidyltransferase (UPF0157 family)